MTHRTALSLGLFIVFVGLYFEVFDVSDSSIFGIAIGALPDLVVFILLLFIIVVC